MLRCVVFFFFLLQLGTAVRADVLSSITPLDFIVKDIVGDKLESEVLLPVHASPHHYALKFSDMRRLRESKLFIWVGPELETMLFKAVSSRSGATLAVSEVVSAWVGKGPINQRREIVTEHARHAHTHTSAYTRTQGDAHHWLSFRNGLLLAEHVQALLAELYPEHRVYFEYRLALFEQEIGRARNEALKRLEPLKLRPFGVYHDGYSAFVEEFDLNQQAHVTLVPDQSLSLKTLLDLNNALGSARCLLGERADSKQAEAVAKKLDLPFVSVDLLGGEITSDAAIPTNFSRYMSGITYSFVACLESAS